MAAKRKALDEARAQGVPWEQECCSGSRSLSKFLPPVGRKKGRERSTIWRDMDTKSGLDGRDQQSDKVQELIGSSCEISLMITGTRRF